MDVEWRRVAAYVLCRDDVGRILLTHPTALLRKLPFVGRNTEHDKLVEKLAEAQHGRGSIVLLAGEPGIGKTRLTDELCEQAAPGATVIRGNCYEEGPPFGPWIEALRALIEQLSDDQLQRALGDAAPDIVPVLPGGEAKASGH